MKAIPLITGLAVTLAGASCALAADKTNDRKEPKPAPAAKTAGAQRPAPLAQTETLSTGSYLKQKVRRNGQITDGQSQVLVIDSTAIKNSGATDLRQLLSQQGIH